MLVPATSFGSPDVNENGEYREDTRAQCTEPHT